MKISSRQRDIKQTINANHSSNGSDITSSGDASSDDYTSYMVRVWHSPDASWRGVVEHVQSGEQWEFFQMAALLNFLHGHAEDC